MTTVNKTIMLTIPVSDMDTARLISDRMGWKMSIPEEEPRKTMSDEEATEFLRSIQLTPEVPVPADENIYDAIVEAKYM